MRFRVRFLAPALAAVSFVILTSLALATEARAQSPLAPIWTGVYLGFHGGGNWSDIGTNIGGASSNELTGGGHAGFNIGLGGLVAGLEADANFDGIDSGFATAGGGVASFSTDWSGSLRARLGVPLGPVLLYATAGYAWTETTLTELTPAGGAFAADHTFDGVVYGAGLETYALPNLSIRLEALRYDYSADKLSISGAAGAIDEIDPSDTVVRAGVTFHLN